ncbi:hypothetical protein J7L67_03360 [bacterium]|nr:hypothetical protein [bacterium]
MKKVIAYAVLIAPIIFSGNLFALPLPYLPYNGFSGSVKGESMHVRPNGHTQEVFIDWIVSDHDLMPQNIGAGDFTFSTVIGGSGGQKGDKAAYDASKYYYYYQIENDNVYNNDVLNTLSVDLDPDLIISAGYVTALDIDVDLLETHDLLGEQENVNGTIVDPDQSKFVQVGLTPHQNWEFNLGLLFGEESSILFLTSNVPPDYTFSSLLSGSRSYDGMLPIPAIPEPFSMLLLSVGCIVLYIRKRLSF